MTDQPTNPEMDELFKKTLNDVDKYINKALTFIKGDSYLKTVIQNGNIDQQRYLDLMQITASVIIESSNPSQIRQVIEELCMVGSTFTQSFYIQNTYPLPVLVDIKFLADNYLSILNFLLAKSDTLTPNIKHSNIIMTQQALFVDDVIKMSKTTDKTKLVQIKDASFKFLIELITSTNGSHEYHNQNIDFDVSDEPFHYI